MPSTAWRSISASREDLQSGGGAKHIIILHISALQRQRLSIFGVLRSSLCSCRSQVCGGTGAVRWAPCCSAPGGADSLLRQDPVPQHSAAPIRRLREIKTCPKQSTKGTSTAQILRTERWKRTRSARSQGQLEVMTKSGGRQISVGIKFEKGCVLPEVSVAQVNGRARGECRSGCA